MSSYQPGVFAVLYNSPFGQKIWKFLNRDEVVAALETASRLGKPAVAGIEEAVLSAFGEKVLENRVKQMIGHMVRQVLERRGWALEQSEVKVSSVPFIKAARYRRPEWHSFHVYRNPNNPRDVVVTDSRQTERLPVGVRWTYYLSFESPLQAAMAFSLKNFQGLRKTVQEKGFLRIEVPRLLRAP